MDVLHATDVQDDSSDVALESQHVAVAREDERLGDGVAADEQHVRPGLAGDCVAAVSGFPLERVVAGSELHVVVALIAVHEVSSVAAEQLVRAIPAEKRVEAGTPSTVMAMSAARLPVAEKMSSPPFSLTNRFSEVPMSMLNGAGSTRSKRTRAPLAVVVNRSALPPPLTSTVSSPSSPSFRSVSSPGFQIIRSSPSSPKTWSSAPFGQRVVFGPAEQRVGAALSLERVGSALAEELVGARALMSASLLAPPKNCPAGSAPLASLKVIASLPASASTRISEVLATVGVPPDWDRPPFTRIVPAASRESTIELGAASPVRSTRR